MEERVKDVRQEQRGQSSREKQTSSKEIISQAMPDHSVTLELVLWIGGLEVWSLSKGQKSKPANHEARITQQG